MSSVVGERVERTDGVTKVTGEAIYGVDYVEPGMLHGKLLRSPVPAGRIAKLDVSSALAMPGVRAAYTAADAPDHLAGWVLREQRCSRRSRPVRRRADRDDRGRQPP